MPPGGEPRSSLYIRDLGEASRPRLGVEVRPRSGMSTGDGPVGEERSGASGRDGRTSGRLSSLKRVGEMYAVDAMVAESLASVEWKSVGI